MAAGVAVAGVAAAELPALGAGYSYRRSYRAQTFANRDRIGMLEIVAEHFMHPSTRDELALLADHFPIVPHGLGMSLGSAEGLDDAYVERFAAVVGGARAPWWSDHVAFTRAGGIDIGHLAPLPWTREALDVLERNVARARSRIARVVGRDVPIVLENIAAPMRWPDAEMSEAAFLGELVARTGCGLLLDVENLHANALNFGEDPRDVLAALPPDSVAQLHVAGGAYAGDTYVDSHAYPVNDAVWALVAEACERFAIRAIVVERDDRLPPFADLLGEIERAGALRAAQPACR
jgi:uncharacterized protein (UPF0276 family)